MVLYCAVVWVRSTDALPEAPPRAENVEPGTPARTEEPIESLHTRTWTR